MKNYDIKTGLLYTDSDAVYNKNENAIEVYTFIDWTADNEVDYVKKENIISDYKVENDLFNLVCWFDISGYEHWVIQQEETNYVSIDVYLKKNVDDYIQEEMKQISEAIIKAESYLEDKLFF
jgi:hypothetical protein